MLLFLNCDILLCQSSKYNSIEPKKIYIKLMEDDISNEELQSLLFHKYPVAQDTLIYQAKLGQLNENPILNFYHQVNEKAFWYGLILLILNFLILFTIIPLIKPKKWGYLILLFINIGLFFYFRSFLLFQEWVFIPTQCNLYEERHFAMRSDVVFTMPQMGLVIEKSDFWWKIETENGIFWAPSFQLIK